MHLPDRLNGGGGRRHAWAYPPAAAVGRVVFRRQFQEAFPQVGRQRFRGHDADNILVDEIRSRARSLRLSFSKTDAETGLFVLSPAVTEPY